MRDKNAEKRIVRSLLVITVAAMAASASFQPADSDNDAPLNQTLEAASSNRTAQFFAIGQLVPQALGAEREYRSLMGRSPSAGQDPAPGSIIFVLRSAVDTLTAEKERALFDLRNGNFCSKCRKSRAELGGEAAFRAHLASVQGEPLPATKADIDATANDYDQKIAAKRRDLDDAEKRAFRASFSRQELGSRIDTARIVWVRATQFECYHHTQAWERERVVTQQKIDRLNEQVAAAEKSLNSATDSDVKASLAAILNGLNRQVIGLQTDLQSRRVVYSRRLESFQDRADTQRQYLRSLVASLSNDFFLPGNGLASGWDVGYTALFPYDLSSVTGVAPGKLKLPGTSPTEVGHPTPEDVLKLLESPRTVKP